MHRIVPTSEDVARSGARERREVLDESPTDPVAMLRLAACQTESGQRCEALATLDRLIAIHPLSAAPRRLRDYLLRH